jgi:hypothetical protein
MAEPAFLAQDTYIMGLSMPNVSAHFLVACSTQVVFSLSIVKTGRWGGVVTAFITMSDIKDEIDWEFPGATTTSGQSNYFWQGVIRTYPSSFD